MFLYRFAPSLRRSSLLSVASGLALLVAAQAPAFAQTAPPDPASETLITARQMSSNEETGIITATGHVEIAHGDYLLHADKVTYDQKTSVMHAEGHVAMLSPSGEVAFADHEDITGDMNQAFAENLSILFPDNSRLKAVTAQRYEGRYTIAEKGVYTACNVCKEDPDNPPLWQMKADQVTHDNLEHEIYYRNATIEAEGLPVFYTPYLAMPDPTVDRRQGLLTPMPGTSPNIGNYVRMPYYFDIADNTDATLTPIVSTVDKLQLTTQYRHRFENGSLIMDGSFTHANLISDTGVNEGLQWRGNMGSSFVYNIDNIWRAGTDINFVSDKSYLARYGLGSPDALTSRAYVEGFQGRNYAALNNYYFQDLLVGTQAVQPIVLPSTTFSALGEPGQTFGGRWSLDGSTLVTSRDNTNQALLQQGPNTRRASLNGGWERQFVSGTGFETTVSGLVRSDNYWADNVVDPSNSGLIYNNVVQSREFAQANLVTRYPIGRSGDGYQQLVEPIVALTAAPNVKADPTLPIEDSLDAELDETNLFSPNRYTGTDLIEGGSRGTYGLRHAVTFTDGARIDMFGGQSYDFTPNNGLPQNSGLSTQASDYVGRIDLMPAPWLNMNYGTRISSQTLISQRQDAALSFGVPEFRPNLRYIQAYQLVSGVTSEVKEATVGFSSNFTKAWTLTATHTQAFAPTPGPRGTGASLNYANECFIFGVSLNQNDVNRLDVASGQSIMFHFYLKNLGGIHTDSVTGANANMFPAEFRQTD